MALKDILKYSIIAILSVLLIVLWLKKPKEIIKETVTERTDTIYIEKPVPTFITLKDYAFFEFPKDSLIYVTDTDTVLIPIPIEEKVYEDSTYYCRISGYNANLEELKVYQKTIEHTIEKTIKQKPLLSIGPSASIGYDPINKKLSTTVGFSIILPIWSYYLK